MHSGADINSGGAEGELVPLQNSGTGPSGIIPLSIFSLPGVIVAEVTETSQVPDSGSSQTMVGPGSSGSGPTVTEGEGKSRNAGNQYSTGSGGT